MEFKELNLYNQLRGDESLATIDREAYGRYGLDEAQCYYYFPSKSSKLSPLLVLVHGGGWVTNQCSNFFKMAEGLSDQGIGVVVLRYRVTDVESKDLNQVEKVIHPMHQTDCVLGIQSILNNTEIEYSDLYLAGHSAGAFMLSNLLLVPHLYQVTEELSSRLSSTKALFLLAGVYDLCLLGDQDPSYKTVMIEPAFGPCNNSQGINLWAKSSPQFIMNITHQIKERINQNTQILFIHSTKDKLLDNQQGYRYLNRLAELGLTNLKWYCEDFGDHNDMPRDQEIMRLIWSAIFNRN